MSFIYSWLDRLGLGSDGDAFEGYVPRCKEALDYFQQGLLGQAEIDAVKSASALEFGFDAILIDEAQDWPQAEADLLAQLYGGNAISLADGVAQLVRGPATNWKGSVANMPKVGARHLDTGLRMKSNLCTFANSLAERAGLKWHVGVNGEAVGGCVIARKGHYDQMLALQETLLEGTLRAGNMPIDMLHCVPPSAVMPQGNRRHSLLASAFERKGWETWDAADESVRRNFPRSVSALRILQYESCRGLEGWVTVLDGLDEFWESKKVEAQDHLAKSGSENETDALGHAETVAWRWCMIPLTRSIDTLVITFRNEDSRLAKLLVQVAAAYPDIVDVGS